MGNPYWKSPRAFSNGFLCVPPGTAASLLYLSYHKKIRRTISRFWGKNGSCPGRFALGMRDAIFKTHVLKW